MKSEEISILIVDDEWNMRNLIKAYLQSENWKISEAESGNQALQRFQQEPFDLIILDIMMPGLNGWEVCKMIREKSHVPILLLTAINETKDKVYGLNIGADDYLTKPFDQEELIARVKALIRRSSVSKETRFTLPEIEINPLSREVRVGEKPVMLTAKEFDLFCIFVKKPNQVFSREVLLEQVWGAEFYGDDRTVDQHIKNIREKMKKAGCTYNPIQTVWGVGYKLHAQK
ncbi:response regulator transcription factor [Ammoniphilus sp. YIM 78166]|uniref:response regulator transcription factor n=1 Tax=Ammoniphilus sp. YIM 78166 TaxID=1644106 RepID=UPI00107010B3|nr:response regulator transcription factor [Ammoniphilus sp. YIM 78166]